MSISFSLNALQEYLNINNVQEADKKIILDLFNSVDITDDYGQNVKDNKLTGDEYPNFVRLIMEKNTKIQEIIKPFIQGLRPEMQKLHQDLTPEELSADREKLREKIEDIFKQAQNNLLTILEKNNLSFLHPTTGEAIPASQLSEALGNLKFDDVNYGSAQALAQEMAIIVNTTPSDGKNPPPLSSQWNCSVEMAMKVLLHEALHIEYQRLGANPGFNTQKEELYTEKNAILLLSQIADNKDLIIYGRKLSELANNNELLETTLQDEFINKNYANRPKDSSGAVNIMGYQLSVNDKVYLDNKFYGNIGAPPEGCLFDQLHENDIRVAGKIGGKVVLQEVKGAQKIEVKDPNGNIKFKAYLLSYANFGL